MLKIKSALIVLGAAVVIGLGGWKAGIFKHQATPLELLSAGISTSKSVPTATENVTLNIKSKENGQEAYSDIGTLTMTVLKEKGQTIDDTKASLAFDGSFSTPGETSALSKINVGGTFLMSGKIFYLKITKLPILPFFDPKMVKDKWFSIDLVDLARKFGGEEQAKEVESQLNTAFNANSLTADYRGIFAKDNFVIAPTFVSSEKIQGHTVKKISFGIDKTKLADFIFDLITAEKNNGKMAETKLPSREEMTKALEPINFSNIVVGVSTDTTRIYTMALTMEVSDPSVPAVISVDMNATLDYDAPVSITVPDKSDSIEKLLGPILGGMMAGGR